ncbi:steroid 17-alpha-hydroxylase 17,20 lyase-like [Paramuricea clavata]|uniref:Steroid 17-alpha-hydroxylase 17,20 lyase-like n=1 Tax=Paramuricea clavata TaxID=317549 RepID=A0A6S7IS07_PARCT|nr:steroid 17-alpha-hydroxylase 17,20 lyase-like [Paramuricea clavata]
MERDLNSTDAGGDKTVVLNCASLVREARLGKLENVSGKAPGCIYLWHEIFGKDLITTDYSPELRFRRRVFKSAIHVFGAGIEQVSERAGHSVNIAIKEIDSHEGKPFSPRGILESSILVQLWEWLTSKKLQLNDSVIKSPSYLPTQTNRDIKRAKHIRNTVFPKEYHAQKEAYSPGVIRNLTDSFISCYEKEITKEANQDIGSMDDTAGLMCDVTFAGSDTTSSSLAWLFLYMVSYPDIQEKVHKELDVVVGSDRLPSWKDVRNMPYLQATLWEVQRVSGMMVVIGTSAIRDMTIGGYDVPKGTFVAVNLAKLHHDEREWPEPEKFKPERFLDSDGQFVGWNKLNGFLLFSIRRRQCAGQPLAKIMLFTFASILLHYYKIELPEGEKIPSTEVSEAALIRRPKDFKIVAKKRKD